MWDHMYSAEEFPLYGVEKRMEIGKLIAEQVKKYAEANRESGRGAVCIKVAETSGWLILRRLGFSSEETLGLMNAD